MTYAAIPGLLVDNVDDEGNATWRLRQSFERTQGQEGLRLQLKYTGNEIDIKKAETGSINTVPIPDPVASAQVAS